MQKVKAFGDWLTKWFTAIVIVWAVFNYFVPQEACGASPIPVISWVSCCSAWVLP